MVTDTRLAMSKQGHSVLIMVVPIILFGIFIYFYFFSITPITGKINCAGAISLSGINVSIASSSGFQVYTNVSGYTDYVLMPGTNGTIYFDIHSQNATSFKPYTGVYYRFLGTDESQLNFLNGISALYSSRFINASPSSTVTVPLRISTAFYAPQSTYLISAPISGCSKGAKPFLFTVGTDKYTGPIRSISFV